MPLTVTTCAPTHRACCDACGRTSDAYGDRDVMVRALRADYRWHIERAWPRFWRWRVLCHTCDARRRLGPLLALPTIGGDRG